MFFTTRARKKKGLTDFISILPFPNQSLRKEAKREVKESTASEPTTTIYTPPITTNSHGENNAPSVPKIISIKQAVANEKEKQQKLLDEKQREPFSVDELTIAWKKFAFQTREAGKETFYHALSKQPPSFTDIEKLTLSVENNIQVEYIRPLLPELIDFLRTTLKNEYIDIEFEVSKTDAEKIVIITGKDKFNALAKINPNLNILKNTFNLDIDY